MGPKSWYQRLLKGIEPLTFGIGAVGSVIAGLGIAFALGAESGLVGFAATMVGFVILYLTGIVIQETVRARMREAAFLFRGSAVDADPYDHFFVTPPFGYADGTGLPPFVKRRAMCKLLRGLEARRFVIVRAPRGSGLSRLLYETAKMFKGRVVLVAKGVVVPTEDPLTALMLDPGGFVADEDQVLFIRDLAKRIATGSIGTEMLREWLARHPRVSIVATLAPADRRIIAEAGEEAETELADIEGLAEVVRLQPRLQGRDLAAAEALFPELKRAQLEWLPRHFIATHPLRRRYAQEGEGRELARAIVRAAVDRRRAGITKPASASFLETVGRRYLEGAADESFDSALAWALLPTEQGVALLYEVEKDGVLGYAPDPAVVSLLDPREVGVEPHPIPDFVWDEVIAELTAELKRKPAGRSTVKQLIAVARAARGLGRGDVVQRALGFAAQHGDESQRQTIVQMLASDSPRGSTLESLVTSRVNDGIIHRLRRVGGLVSPAAQRRGSGAADGTRSCLAWIYRRRVIRTIVRLSLLSASDVVAAGVGLAVGLIVRVGLAFGEGDFGTVIAELNDSIALWSAITVFSFALVKLYRQASLRARLGRIVLAMSVLAGIGLVGTLAEGYGLLTGLFAATAGWLTSSWIDYRLRVIYDRVSQSWVMDHALGTRTVLIGSARQAALLKPSLEAQSRPTKVVGYLTLDGSRAGGDCLGSVADLGQIAIEKRIGRVVIADAAMPVGTRLGLADRWHRLGLEVEAVPSLEDVRAGAADFVPGQPLALIKLEPLWQADPGFFTKRALDISLAAFALLLLSPAILLVSVLTLLGSGRIITRSWRHGKGTAVFGMYRFCTTKRAVASPRDPSDVGGGRGEEMTALGAWLSRRGLDEVPQLVNVLLGEMSLVGPRPLRLIDYSKLHDEQLLRYVVAPGVTSAWQVSTRQALTPAELISLDIAYLRKWSILIDLEILVKTARLLIRGRLELPALIDEDDLGPALSSGREHGGAFEAAIGQRRARRRP